MAKIQIARTWHMQHGSVSGGDSTIDSYFRCFISFNIVASLSPVLTSPMRSSRAKSSCYRKYYIMETTYVKDSTNRIRADRSSGKKFDFVYLIRHVINIQAHISVPIVHFRHTMVHEWVKEHVILYCTKGQRKFNYLFKKRESKYFLLPTAIKE